ncbi:MAG: aminotransferase class III-fold pyridoxal phosphate-dependent enzyme [Rhodospirillaceae bacterium]|nr:aminotransferase class III-fold pyridoxal phosphate-dependent enzyme [Rhodospirillaceae bacterium]
MCAAGANLSEVYPVVGFEPVAGEGVYLHDRAGGRVLDLYGGHAVASLGYAHPRLTAAITRQADALLFQSNLVAVRVRDEAAERLAAFAPAALSRVFFVNSGAEANENALRIALAATARSTVVAMEHGFHGRTAAAAAVTWGAAGRWYGFPRPPFDVRFVPRNDLAALRTAVDGDTAAIIIEPVQGVAGAFDFSPAFMTATRELCDRYGALLILDEVQTGVGRLGTPFGADLFGVQPDLLTTAKGLGGGFPCAALLMTDALAADLGAGAMGSTFGGGPVACAALLSRVRAMAALIESRCVCGPVTGTQGAGFLLGLKTAPRAARVRDALLEKGILTGTSADPHVLRLLPPLILEAQHVEELARALQELHSETLQ